MWCRSQVHYRYICATWMPRYPLGNQRFSPLTLNFFQFVNYSLVSNLSPVSSRGPVCPTWPKTLWNEFSRWTPMSGSQLARPSSTRGSSAWPHPHPWRTYSAVYLRTSWSGRLRAATAPNLPSPRAPVAPPNPTKLGGCERRSYASWTVATSSSTMAETGTLRANDCSGPYT